MIQPLQFRQSVTFKSSNTNQTPTSSVKSEVETPIENKQVSTPNKLQTLIHKGVKVLKGVNSVAYPAAGIVRGAIEGVGAAAVVGLIGKNAKNAEGKILGTIGGVAKDTAKGIGKTLSFLPSVLTKAPLENIKTIFSIPKKFYCDYLKGNKATGAIATIGAAMLLGIRYIQGHINANKANASIDHKTGGTHA